MLCRKFELIPIKIRFFMNFKVAPKSSQRLSTNYTVNSCSPSE